jgi:hypothetical protein
VGDVVYQGLEAHRHVSAAVFDICLNGGGEQTDEMPASLWLEPDAAVV